MSVSLSLWRNLKKETSIMNCVHNATITTTSDTSTTITTTCLLLLLLLLLLYGQCWALLVLKIQYAQLVPSITELLLLILLLLLLVVVVVVVVVVVK